MAGGVAGLFDQAKAAAEKAAEAASKIAQDAADHASRVSETMQDEYRKTFVELDCKIVFVRPKLAVMEFPSYDAKDRLAKRINVDHGQQVLIYNLSGKKYDASKFQGEVVDVDIGDAPVLPLERLFELSLAAHEWLQADSRRVFIVHCLEDYARSALFMSCLMAIRGHCEGPAEALEEICKVLAVDSAAVISPSQRRYVGYCQQCLQGSSPPPRPLALKLTGLRLSSVPGFDETSSVAFRPYVELWSGGECIFASNEACLPELLAIDTDADLGLQGEPSVSTDAFVRIFHVPASAISALIKPNVKGGAPNVVRETVGAFFFHPAFEPHGLQLAKADLDGACRDERVAEDAVLRLMARQVGEAADGREMAPSPLFERARSLAARCREEAQRQLADERQREAIRAPALSDDEGDELEKTLLRAAGAPPAAPAATASSAEGMSCASVSTSGAAGAKAEEDSVFRAALAEAMAEDAMVDRAKSAAPEAPKSASAAGGGYVATKAPAAAAHAKPLALLPTSASLTPEIDDLFSDFDAALDAMSSTTAPKAGAPTTRAVAPTPTTAAPPKSAPHGDADLFGDTDDFLKSLEGVS